MPSFGCMGCVGMSRLHTCGKEPKYREPVFDTEKLLPSCDHCGSSQAKLIGAWFCRSCFVSMHSEPEPSGKRWPAEDCGVFWDRV